MSTRPKISLHFDGIGMLQGGAPFFCCRLIFRISLPDRPQRSSFLLNPIKPMMKKQKTQRSLPPQPDRRGPDLLGSARLPRHVRRRRRRVRAGMAAVGAEAGRCARDDDGVFW